MFTPHPSTAVEYWFFKVNAGPIALIVDWIERRRRNEHVLRVSIHSPYKREVIFENLVTAMTADNFLSTQKTAGHAGDVSWDLNIDPGPEWIKPDSFPVGALRMTDTTIVSAPLARFNGWIRSGAEQTSFVNVPGLLSQYWGRQLSLDWWWVSAHQFDREGIVVECVEARSTLWGTGIQFPIGYIYLRQGEQSELFMAPIHPMRVEGSPERFKIEMNRKGREKLTLIGTGREYGDFGEQIVNTLTGDLEIWEGDRLIACANGTAALERRTPATHGSRMKRIK